MKKFLLVGIAAVALAAAGSAQAASGLGLRGETGLMRTPLAAALPPLTLAVAADFVASDDVFLPMRAEIGVIDGLEVGGNFWFLDTPGSATVWGLNAKYVLPQFVENLSLAFGGHFRQQSINGLENDGHDVYLVTSYPFGFLVPTFGLRYESITGDNSKSDLRFFGSLVANVLPNLCFGAEIESPSDKLDGTGADPVMWFGVRYLPMENFTVEGGLINYADIGAGLDNSAQNDFILHIGVQYAFSFVR